ncbi:MAG: AhpC/TSA family protein [Chitinophagaceae bacterium]|jgi:peroxiredoxin|nr:AhpC/TSA family protein [Chitinophagaceae bacterium]
MKIKHSHFAISLVFFFLLALEGNLGAQSLLKLHLAGTIKGVPDGTEVHLVSSTLQGWSTAPAKVVKATFNLEAELPQPDLFVLTIGSLNDQKALRYQLFLDNEIVELAIDATANSIQLISGPSPVAFTELMQSFGPQFDNLSAISRLRQTAGGNGYYSDSLAKAWDKQLAEIASGIGPFVQKHPNTAVSAFLLSTVWPLYNNVQQMDGWLSLMGPVAKESIFAESLEEQMGNERTLGYGQVAPDFAQEDPDGKPVSLKDFRGKYVLVDFWASWCGPCRQENPNVVQAYKKYKNKNFTVLGVSLDRDKPRWLQAISDDQLTWPHVSDLKFWQNEVAKLYKVSSIPQNYLLDPEGRIIGKNLRGAALEEFLEKTLGAN